MLDSNQNQADEEAREISADMLDQKSQNNNDLVQNQTLSEARYNSNEN